jgi:ATP-binding cassette, subfamily B, bacterial
MADPIVASPVSMIRRPYASIAASPRLRALRILVEASPWLAGGALVLALADALLPNLVIVAMGRATGQIPDAVRDGLGSSAGVGMLAALAVAGVVYALSLLRGPAEDALSSAARARVSLVMQRRVVDAVCEPAGIAHLEDPEVLDRLASATGDLRGDEPADAPMTVLGIAGDRLAGVVSCVVLATFRWWVGLVMLVVWLAVRGPTRAFVVSRVGTFRTAAPALRRARYHLGLATRSEPARELRLFGLADWTIGRHRDLWLEAMDPSWRELRSIDRRVAAVAVAVLGAYLLCGGALGLAAYHGEIGLETLATMLPMLPMTMRLGSITATDVGLAGMLSSLPDVDALAGDLASPEELGGAGRPAAGLPAREVRFEDVGFRYPGGREDVLDGLDLTLHAGRSLALVGLNGAGKTTLVTLLARLRDPGRGRILVDGIPLGDLDAAEWQRQVAVVFQEPMRLPLTARENVALGDPGPDPAALERAAERAGAADVVAGLPDRWDTVLSARYPGGVDPSGGQWQRLALARALYAVERGARILVLDEPTSQLDVRREAAFYDRFLQITADTTSIVISHRFSTVRRADRIAVLEDGGIAELGSHDELMAAGGRYATMFELQAAPFREEAG